MELNGFQGDVSSLAYFNSSRTFRCIQGKRTKEYIMNGSITPVFAFFHDPWVANLAILCLVALYIAALIRSQTNKGEEGAH